MITAQLKGVSTIDMIRLEDYKPENPTCFRVFIRAMVGPRGSEGAEAFTITVCTPAWVEKEVEKDGFVVGRHYLVVRAYDPGFIEKLIRKFVERWSGESWSEVAEKVARIGDWEFEDYPGLKSST